MTSGCMMEDPATLFEEEPPLRRYQLNDLPGLFASAAEQMNTALPPPLLSKNLVVDFTAGLGVQQWAKPRPRVTCPPMVPIFHYGKQEWEVPHG